MPLAFSFKRLVVLILLFALAGAGASAQTSEAPQSSLQAILVPDTTVWIVDSAGREEKRRVVSVSADLEPADGADGLRSFRTTEIRQVRVRRFDSVINGAV